MLLLLCLALGALVGHGDAQAAEHDVLLSELDGSCLPGLRDQGDHIVFQEVISEDACVGEDFIGVQFDHGEFAARWKALRLHRQTDPSTSKDLLELKDAEGQLTALVPALSLRLDFDIYLWKAVSEVIGWGDYPIYRIVDTNELQPGRMYRFVWFRDDECV